MSQKPKPAAESRSLALVPAEREKKVSPIPGAKPFVKGDPRINRTRPGPGRRPDQFKRLCQRYTMKALKTKVRRILRDPDHQHFMAAVRWASDHGFGKPSQRIEVDHRLTLEDLITASREGEEE